MYKFVTCGFSDVRSPLPTDGGEQLEAEVSRLPAACERAFWKLLLGLEELKAVPLGPALSRKTPPEEELKGEDWPFGFFGERATSWGGK